MSGSDLDALIAKAKMGSLLTTLEQSQLADELVIYRGMALRLERCVHDLTKDQMS